jgi:hypothetical protein
MNDYSRKEVALITYFLPYLVEKDMYKNIAAPSLYKMMVEECFLRHPVDDNVFKISLWNCFIAFNKSRPDKTKIYRMTSEWDALISDEVLGTDCSCTLNDEMNFVTIQSCCEICDKFSKTDRIYNELEIAALRRALEIACRRGCNHCADDIRQARAALACGVPAYAIGLREFTIAHDTRIRHFDLLEDALAEIRRTTQDGESTGERHDLTHE